MTDINNAFKVKHGLIATTATIDALILNGSSPITDVAQLTGPQGDPGPQGEQGIQGEQGDPGSPGVGVPTGGTAGQVLSKIDSTDYNTEWIDQSVETPGQTNAYTRDALPTGAIGLIITVSDSGDDENSPAGNYALAYWDNDTSEWLYMANSNSVTIITV
jgi:hypothetical protein